MNFKSYEKIMDLANRAEGQLLDLEDYLAAAYAGSEGAEEQAERIRQARQLLANVQKEATLKLDK